MWSVGAVRCMKKTSETWYLLGIEARNRKHRLVDAQIYQPNYPAVGNEPLLHNKLISCCLLLSSGLRFSFVPSSFFRKHRRRSSASESWHFYSYTTRQTLMVECTTHAEIKQITKKETWRKEHRSRSDAYIVLPGNLCKYGAYMQCVRYLLSIAHVKKLVSPNVS